MHVSTRGRDRSHNSKGENLYIHLVECIHSFGRLHLLKGSHIRIAFARCVEPLPLLEGLAVLGVLSFASGVEPVASC